MKKTILVLCFCILEVFCSFSQDKKHKLSTAMIAHIYNGDIDTVALCLSLGADPNDAEFSSTPLCWAISLGQDKITFLLMNNQQIDLEKQNKIDGFTPLMEAVYKNNFKVVEALLKKGAKPDILNPFTGETALNMAIDRSNDSICQLILDFIPNINLTKNPRMLHPFAQALSDGRTEIASMIIDKGLKIDSPILYGGGNLLPLNIAIQYNNEDIIKKLLEKGASCIINDDYGMPLFSAANTSNREIFNQMLTAGNVNIKNKSNVSLLHAACDKGNYENVKLILNYPFDVNSKDQWGCTPLFIASEKGFEDIVELLLQQKEIDKDIADTNGITPLIAAILNKNNNIVINLVEKGANINKKENDGFSPLMGAIITFNNILTKYLIDKGVDIELQDNNGMTPLMWAVKKNNFTAVKYLCEKGANKMKINKRGKTVLQIAQENGLLLISDYLKNKNKYKDYSYSCSELVNFSFALDDSTSIFKLINNIKSKIPVELSKTSFLYSLIMFNVSGMYNSFKKYDSAIVCLNEAMLVAKKDTNSIGGKLFYTNLLFSYASCYLGMSKFDFAEKYAKRAINNITDTISPGGEKLYGGVLYLLGKIKIKQQKKDSALYYINKAKIYINSSLIKLDELPDALLLSIILNGASLADTIIDNSDPFGIFNLINNNFFEYELKEQKELLGNYARFKDSYLSYLYLHRNQAPYNFHPDLPADPNSIKLYGCKNLNGIQINGIISIGTEMAFSNEIILKRALMESQISQRETIIQSNNKSLLNKYDALIATRNRLSVLFLEKDYNIDSILKYKNREKILTTQIEEMISQFIPKNINKVPYDYAYKNIMPCLKENEAIIEYTSFNLYKNGIISDSIIYAAIVYKKNYDRPKLVFLCEEKNLLALFKKDIYKEPEQKQIKYYNKLYVSSNSKKNNLYDLIWKPLTRLISDSTKLYIVPSGLLNTVSFAALTNPETETTIASVHNIQYLISSHKLLEKVKPLVMDTSFYASVYGGIVYNDPIDTMILRAKPYKNSGHSRISFPTRKPCEVPYLIGTKLEADSIYFLIKKHCLKVDEITGDCANEESFKAFNGKSPQIIHIATHGIYINPDFVNSEDDRPLYRSTMPMMRSALLMAGVKNSYYGDINLPINIEDGLLTAYEVSNLDLSKTNLVVMSACQSGLGDIIGSEGVYGLQRGFMLAGVKHLIMTLWPVDDKVTSEFMILFYKNLLSNNKENIANIHTAFTKTQDAIREKYKKPYYWAPFILIE